LQELEAKIDANQNIFIRDNTHQVDDASSCKVSISFLNRLLGAAITATSSSITATNDIIKDDNKKLVATNKIVMNKFVLN